MAEVIFVNMKKEDFLGILSNKSCKPLFKHMPLVYALDSLQCHRLWFATPETWSDPFEQRFYAAQYETPCGTSVMPFPWKDKVFCSCFTTRAASEAHWNRSKTDSVMLHFKRDELLKLLSELPNNLTVYIGKVQYLQTKEIQTSDLSKIPFNGQKPTKSNIDDYCARLLLLKRNAFMYEEEIRIMIVNKSEESVCGRKGDYFLRWNQGYELIPNVTLSPLQSDEANEKLKDFLTKNYGVKVLISRLYKASKPRKTMKW